VQLPLVLGKWKCTVSEIKCNIFNSKYKAKQWHIITRYRMLNTKYKTIKIIKRKFKRIRILMCMSNDDTNQPVFWIN
jgi:hypothetical protein